MITSIRWWDLSALGAVVTFADGTRKEYSQVPPDIYLAFNRLYDSLIAAKGDSPMKCAMGAFSRRVWRTEAAERDRFAWLDS